MTVILNKDLVIVSKKHGKSGVSFGLQFFNNERRPPNSHRSQSYNHRRIDLNQTFDFSTYPTRHDSDESFSMNQSTNTSMIISQPIKKRKSKKRGSKLGQFFKSMFGKKQSVG